MTRIKHRTITCIQIAYSTERGQRGDPDKGIIRHHTGLSSNGYGCSSALEETGSVVTPGYRVGHSPTTYTLTAAENKNVRWCCYHDRTNKGGSKTNWNVAQGGSVSNSAESRGHWGGVSLALIDLLCDAGELSALISAACWRSCDGLCRARRSGSPQSMRIPPPNSPWSRQE
jgi:hypothetical protein